jgi:hypothetical protein
VTPPVRCWLATLATEIGADRCDLIGGFPGRVEMPAQRFMDSAAALFTCHPLTTVTLTDRAPDLEPGYWGWHLPWDKTFMSEIPNILPVPLFAELDGMTNPDDPTGDEFAYYDSRETALAALSRAGVRFGRRLAGLPSLRPLPSSGTGVVI